MKKEKMKNLTVIDERALEFGLLIKLRGGAVCACGCGIGYDGEGLNASGSGGCYCGCTGPSSSALQIFEGNSKGASDNFNPNI